MPNISNSHANQQDNALAAVKNFCSTFSRKEALKLQHKMIRAAFAQKRKLHKKDVLDLLFLKEKLETLIEAAARLAKDKTNGQTLKKVFHKAKAVDWIAWLDELFHAAVYNDFFTNPSMNPDVYYSCRGLLKIIKKCYAIVGQDAAIDMADREDKRQGSATAVA